MGGDIFSKQGPSYLIFIGFQAIGCLVAAITRNERYHKTWSVLFPSVEALFTTIAQLHLG